ncbi:single-stranded DNA-binding protein [Paenibacillus sp. ACRRX]|uniref:single-stranded DNA-binding protein n=1 Tax=Paenibacillus sp. ACRRX TaxID=2918206 RepID=UPI001EF6ADC4|nr:single-stranded DNA-binding protein [Paenibacillus sp. ACRRX]MCG7407736.1 single-stranded DNA-binding protein [Paenibacillus sp. ACRRX]
MSIRNALKQREERRDQAANGGINGGLPEGVTRYVRLGQELKDGKTFVLLADPDKWFFYYTHEDGDFATHATYVRKHTCLHSPHEVGEDFGKYEKPNKTACLSCAAKAKRKLYFMIPVFDPQYSEWRVLDLKEYHASNIIGDYDKLEKAAQKFQKGYTLVGDAVTIGKTSDGKSYSMSSGDLDDAVIEAAKKLVGQSIDYEELANFREVDDIAKILAEATPEAKLDKSVLGAAIPPVQTKDDVVPIEPPIDISDADIPF